MVYAPDHRPYYDADSHIMELPDFGALDVGHCRALGQHDTELLLSYLTVPYLRVPLILSFFASDDRIHALQSEKLQGLLEAASRDSSPPLSFCRFFCWLLLLAAACCMLPGMRWWWSR